MLLMLKQLLMWSCFTLFLEEWSSILDMYRCGSPWVRRVWSPLWWANSSVPYAVQGYMCFISFGVNLGRLCEGVRQFIFIVMIALDYYYDFGIARAAK